MMNQITRTNLPLPAFAICNYSPQVFEPLPLYSSNPRSSNSSPSDKLRLPLAFSNMIINKKYPQKSNSKSPNGPKGYFQKQSHSVIKPPNSGSATRKMEPDYVECLRRPNMKQKPDQTIQKSSSVKIVTINEQASVKKQNSDRIISEPFQQKVTMRYNHFRRTQNSTFGQYLGKIRSAIEVKIKGNNGEGIQHHGKEDSNLSQAYQEEAEKPTSVENRMIKTEIAKYKVLEEDLSAAKKYYEDIVITMAKEHKGYKEASISESYLQLDSHNASLVPIVANVDWKRPLESSQMEGNKSKNSATRTLKVADEIEQIKCPAVYKPSSQRFYMNDKDKCYNSAAYRRAFSLFDSSHILQKFENLAYQEKLNNDMLREKEAMHVIQTLKPVNRVKLSHRESKLDPINVVKDTRETQSDIKRSEPELQPKIVLNRKEAQSKLERPRFLGKIEQGRSKSTTIIAKPYNGKVIFVPQENVNSDIVRNQENEEMPMPLVKQHKRSENMKKIFEENIDNFTLEGWNLEGKGASEERF